MHPALSRAFFESETHGITEEHCALRQWQPFKIEYPVLDVGFTSEQGAQLRVRLLCDDWNELPPPIELLNFDGEYLTKKPARSDIFNEGPHQMTGRPFICMRGAREYHLHESHRFDAWDELKGDPKFRLGEILTQIWNGWRHSHT